ncbi:MAG: double-strand break repair helicase AddA [Alphaproteobacteria bacterium]
MTHPDATALVAEATRRQIRAADPEISAWVVASAGSGKTRVLINRFIRLLLTGTKPQHILCLTYTRAAAAEMSDRIMQELSQWAVCSHSDLTKRVTDITGGNVNDATLDKARGLFAQVLDCPGGLKIKTFHAFAQEILARFPLEAALAPHFTLLDEPEAQDLQSAALDHILADADDVATRAAWAHLVGVVGAEKIVTCLHSFMHESDKYAAALREHGTAENLAIALCVFLDVDPAKTPENYRRHLCTDPQLPLELLRKIIAVVATDADAAATTKTAVTELAAWLEQTDAARATTYDDFLNFFLTKESGHFCDVRKNIPNKKFAVKHPDLVASWIAAAETVRHQLQHYRTLQRVATTRAILHLGHKLRQAYQSAKNTTAAVDYDDIISKTEALLHEPGVAPWILWKLDGGIDHIMIDEAQDTSPAQWRIIRALTEEFFSGLGARDKNRTLFVVGDEKQSIYSFQHADPAEFLRQRNYFKIATTRAGQTFETIELNISFRSAPQILRTVDDIFRPETVRTGVSTLPILHAAQKQEAQGYVELWPILRPPADDDDDSNIWEPRTEYRSTEAPHARLASVIAARIATWCAAGQSIDGHLRSVKPGDIMILVSRRNELVQALVRELKERSVPVSGVDRMQINAQIGVRDLLALIQCALLPEDDLNLACVLRGPMIGMDDLTLEDICHSRTRHLWQALRDAAAPHARAAYSWLDNLRDRADRLTPYDFLTHVLTQPCPAARSGRLAMRMRLGADAADPVDELLNRAQEYGQRHTPALQSFLCAMRRNDSEIKRELDRGGGEVRIMTVHAAKGLQAPIVILPDTCAVPQAQKIPALQWDPATRLPYYTDGTAETRDAFANQLRQTAQEERHAEHRRLLYVALTRAENQLYIYGYKGKSGATSNFWHQYIQNALAPDAKPEPEQPLVTLMDPILPSATKSEQALPSVSSSTLPDWIFTAASPEAMSHSLRPSQFSAVDDGPASPTQRVGRDQATRGKMLHMLLQYLPDIPEATRTESALRFMERHASYATPAQRAESVAEVMKILGDPRYAALFAARSRAEVSIAGTVHGVPISGQIDRLVEHEKSVMIVDYKTTRPPPAHVHHVPEHYLRQMAAYRALLRQITPDKSVRCFLLWTYTGQIMELPEYDLAALDLAAA